MDFVNKVLVRLYIECLNNSLVQVTENIKIRYSTSRLLQWTTSNDKATKLERFSQSYSISARMLTPASVSNFHH